MTALISSSKNWSLIETLTWIAEVEVVVQNVEVVVQHVEVAAHIDTVKSGVLIDV
jgi:hypothetical protein